MKVNYIESFKSARRASVPIIIIRTPDYTSTIKELMSAYDEGKCPGIVQWDVCRGAVGVNDKGTIASEAMNPDSDTPIAMQTGNPTECLTKALDLMPPGNVLFMLNAQLFTEGADDSRKTVIQAIWNCRDSFKGSKRTLVLMVPSMQVPVELNNDVIVIDVALPDEQGMKAVVLSQFKAAKLEAPDPEILRVSVDALSGLSAFSAEQVAAMSLSPAGIDVAALWRRKKAVIESAGGLTVHQEATRFDDLGGLENIKSYLRRIISGKRRPRIIVLIDEIEKQMSGTADTSGINQDALGQMLSNMQDNDWSGVLFPGFPGSGKTELAKAMGGECGALFAKLDMGALKNSLVGDSEKLVRNAMKTLFAMGSSEVFFIGTCNSMAAIKPELKRRFRYGTFFFDLPTMAEQGPIWDIYMRKLGIAKQKLPACEGWTGAEIRQVCLNADEFGVTLIEAAQYISPVVKSMGDEVTALRKSAAGKYLSASAPGLYQPKVVTKTAVERIIENN